MIKAQDTCTDDLGNPAPTTVLNADLALLLCARTWGCPDPPPEDRAAWLWLEPAWRDRLLDLIELTELPGPPGALDLLRQSHRLQGRADLDRVHASWWIRALQDESPAVRRAIASHGPPRVRAAAHAVLGEGSDDMHDAPPSSSEVMGWVLALWTERLVGGEPVGANDPPVIVAMAGLPPSQLVRLGHAAGLAKAALAEDPLTQGGRPAEKARTRWLLDWLHHRLEPDAALAQAWARRELDRPRRPEENSRRFLAGLGLKTLARLLARCEPYRTRWALQHVPYPVAKRIRSMMPSGPVESERDAHLEEAIFQAAWNRLDLERRLARPHPHQPPRTVHAG